MDDKSARDRLSEKEQSKQKSRFEEGKDSLLSRINSKTIMLLIGITVIGILLTFLPKKTGVNKDINSIPVIEANEADPEDESVKAYEKDLEDRLKQILKQMDGVGDVDVMITLKTTKNKVLAEEVKEVIKESEEHDNEGGQRITNETTLEQQVVKAGGTVPYIIREDMPTVEGAIIVAENGDDARVQAQIIEAVSAVLGVPVHKVSVLKMGSK